MPKKHKPVRRSQKSRKPRSGLNYQSLEQRQMLAADFSAQVVSQSNVTSYDNVWRQLDVDDVDTTRYLNVDASSMSLVDLNETGLTRILNRAPQEFTDGFVQNASRVSIPTPEGGFQEFAIVETKVMADELAAEFPDIKTYRGWAVGGLHHNHSPGCDLPGIPCPGSFW